MTHKTQQKFCVVFQVVVLYLSSLLLGYSNSWVQAAIGAENTFPNEMLKQADEQKRCRPPSLPVIEFGKMTTRRSGVFSFETPLSVEML
jgi:hypothetical protein